MKRRIERAWTSAALLVGLLGFHAVVLPADTLPAPPAAQATPAATSFADQVKDLATAALWWGDFEALQALWQRAQTSRGRVMRSVSSGKFPSSCEEKRAAIRSASRRSGG